ncbi:MAG TPA: prolipoprotein diacylglyceryl transferase family protein [Dokdonella sp.]|nr:prolipoprotein diacylglyceryl transferase family protein [Dokdonella sp.]
MEAAAVHTVVEASAYAVGFRLFLRERRRLSLPVLADADRSVWIGFAAIVGAAIGAKLGYWIEDPRGAFADFPDVHRLLEGKTIVGALLGGLAGVELAKRAVGAHGSSGDAFAFPLLVGIAIGRIGCYLSGLADHTYGNPSALPWAVDFGDGIARHPTQLYEVAFLVALGIALHTRRGAFARTGDRFRGFMVAYLAFRLLVDAIKPVPYAYPGGLSGIQLLCIAGLCYYCRDLPRLGRALWARR